MAPVVYLHWISAPCRGVAMTCRKLGIEAEYKFVDLMTGEQNKPEFVEMNPEHCVPTIKDGDFVLWESRAIVQYLMDKYAPDSDLYPKDVEKRANVNKMLYQDMGIVYKGIGSYVYPRAFENKESSPEEMETMFQRLEDHVFKNKDFVACDHLTIADLFIVASITFTEIVGYKFPHDRFPKLGAWLKKLTESEWYVEYNKEYEVVKSEMLEKLKVESK